MARARKRHVQQQLRFLDKNGQHRGGKRTGAGRPKRGERASEPHKLRPTLKSSEPVHVVIRAVRDVGNLRGYDAYHAIRKAIVRTYAHDGFRIVHLSIQGTHVHLMIEAKDRTILARGMQGFQISAAKHLNAAISKRKGLSRRRRGTVFADRYHAEIVRSPRQARHALVYVLNNWRRHAENATTSASRSWRIDPFSSAVSFDGWTGVDVSAPGWGQPYDPLPVATPKTWLLREGWRRHGLIRWNEVPGPKWTAKVQRQGRRERAPEAHVGGAR